MITQERPNGDARLDDTAAESDPVARLRVQLDELQTYIRQQWAARTDRALVALRRLVVLSVVGAVALLAAGTWVATAVVLFLLGATDGLGILLSGRIWLANLIVGASALALVVVVAMAVYGFWAGAARKQTKIKYQHREREQRRRFGHTAHDRASH